MSGLFPAFFDHPTNIRFAEQEADEVIELFLRRHWITNVPWIFLTILAFIAPAVLIQLDLAFNLHLFMFLPNEFLTGGLIIWYMLIVAYALEKFLFWYYNIYIVTSVHLVDIDFLNLLFRQITEIKLKDVESVRTKIGGVFGPLFNFGNVEIETAAAAQNSIFEKVPRPDIVADRIEDLRETIAGGGD